MNCITRFVRGASIEFIVTFFDANDHPTVVDTARLYLSYLVYGDVSELTIEMDPPTSGEFAWTASWDSGVADVGDVTWLARSGDPPPYAEVEGSIELIGNAAANG